MLKSTFARQSITAAVPPATGAAEAAGAMTAAAARAARAGMAKREEIMSCYLSEGRKRQGTPSPQPLRDPWGWDRGSPWGPANTLHRHGGRGRHPLGRGLAA